MAWQHPIFKFNCIKIMISSFLESVIFPKTFCDLNVCISLRRIKFTYFICNLILHTNIYINWKFNYKYLQVFHRLMADNFFGHKFTEFYGWSVCYRKLSVLAVIGEIPLVNPFIDWFIESFIKNIIGRKCYSTESSVENCLVKLMKNKFTHLHLYTHTVCTYLTKCKAPDKHFTH